MFIYVRNAIRLKPMERKGRALSKVKCPYTEKDGVNNSSFCQLSIEQICFQAIALSTERNTTEYQLTTCTIPTVTPFKL